MYYVILWSNKTLITKYRTNTRSHCLVAGFHFSICCYFRRLYLWKTHHLYFSQHDLHCTVCCNVTSLHNFENYKLKDIILSACTAHSIMISYWHDTIICLSVTLCIVAKQLKCLEKWTGCAIAPQEYDFTTFHPTLTLSSKTPHILHHRCWCHLTNKLKTYLALLLTFLNLKSTFTTSKQTGIKSSVPFETANK